MRPTLRGRRRGREGVRPMIRRERVMATLRVGREGVRLTIRGREGEGDQR